MQVVALVNEVGESELCETNLTFVGPDAYAEPNASSNN
jgi:hypothetical protein